MIENKIFQGDCLEVLKKLPSESINMCMTSPPYWALRDYGTAIWKGGDLNCDHKAAKEKSRYDYEVKSKKQVVKGGTSGTDAPKWKNKCPTCGAIKEDKQLGLEEDFDLYISKLCDIFDEVKRVLRKDGTCWVNIGDTYGTISGGSKQLSKGDKTQYGLINHDNRFGTMQNKPKSLHKSLIMIPFRFAIEMVNRGWILRNTIIWHKPNCMPSSVKDRFTNDFEYLFFFSKNKKYYFEQQFEEMAESSKQRLSQDINSQIGSERGHGKNKTNGNMKAVGNIQKGRNKRTTWTITTKGFKGAHFAVYPEELCETPIKAGCPTGGIVLDPFFGAGTTGLVALKQNKKFVGIELNPEYIEIAKARIKRYEDDE